jgi:hypothetical protein
MEAAMAEILEELYQSHQVTTRFVARLAAAMCRQGNLQVEDVEAILNSLKAGEREEERSDEQEELTTVKRFQIAKLDHSFREYLSR